MATPIGRIAIIGQGLIGSSITRAVYVRNVAVSVTVTDADPKVRDRVRELGLGQAKIVDTAREAARDADLVILCVPVSRLAEVARDIAPVLKPGAILSDVGSVKDVVTTAMAKVLPDGVALVPAHPLAGTEFSGPDAGLPELFVNRWCILTPVEGTDPEAVEGVAAFWRALGSETEVMTPLHHDYVLSITSHLPHLAAFSIIQTGLKYEGKLGSEVMKFSAGSFRDFTRIASSNPSMWRDIFLSNKQAVLEVLGVFIEDMQEFSRAISEDDGARLEEMLSKSRLTRRKVIEKEHISVRPKPESMQKTRPLARPYSSDF